MQASPAYKTCSPHERFIALIRTALLFPLYPQGHQGSGCTCGQGTELELGPLNLFGLVSATCLSGVGGGEGAHGIGVPILQV